MQLIELVRASADVAATRSRKRKIAILAAALGRLAPDERSAGSAWLAGALEHGKIGLGPAAVYGATDVPAAPEAALTVAETAEALEAIRTAAGPGSSQRRSNWFVGLLERATPEEQDFVRRLVLGELRQGALTSLVLEGLATAAQVSLSSVRRAHMFAGALAPVVRAAFEDGEAGLARFDLVLFGPVHPMLAQPADDLEDAWAQLDSPYVELKMDGARVQIHRDGDDVRVFSRRLNDVTGSLPEIVKAVLALPAKRFVIDGEIIALDPAGRPRSFQTTMRRFGRASDVEKTRAEIPLSLFAFDCLHAEGQTLVDRPARERLVAMDRWLPPELAMPRLVRTDLPSARGFLDEAFARGHEGIMAKSEGAPYDAGRRGAHWLKIKAVHTLDLVVLAAEWGSGRRKGWLSNLHLGAMGPDGAPVMVGKTFKGLTDALLKEQTAALLARQTERWAYGVKVRPELVVEVAIGGVQTSSQYPGGLSLRFARVRRYRPDKSPAQIDGLDRLRSLLVPDSEASR